MSQQGVLPNLIIIGAMKSGTTSLHHYLSLHPEIFMSRDKELKFFVEDKNWNQGIDWYKSHFPGQTKISGESSTGYTKYPVNQRVAEKIHAIIPNAKLIYLLRDPVERVISHYLHRYIAGTENLQINDALAKLENNDYIYESMYFLQLQQYLNYFPDANILILTLEDLSTNTQQSLEKIFKFLEIESDSYPLKQFKKIHQSVDKRRKTKLGNFISKMPLIKEIEKLPSQEKWYLEKIIYFPFSQKVEKPQLEDDIRQKLINYLQEDINSLRKHTGYEFSNWCV
ncbi:sulfotransferase [Gloeocapsa sp. PCC 73106]|uniref:sulfotransferase family protein n=1 Tax=Gloeocapsa sp. PCC 73106 TaxID=102232 RepID=UPI0002ACEA98|nr:sulfotransferase [Gloeocapsa sp. PCC 73106]ELR97382.1 sulfotransferase family protein [Gloeocapsa sp. PCC 73106]